MENETTDDRKYSEADVLRILHAYTKEEKKRRMATPVVAAISHAVVLAILFVLVIDRPAQRQQGAVIQPTSRQIEIDEDGRVILVLSAPGRGEETPMAEGVLPD
jgi:hypothetical protein